MAMLIWHAPIECQWLCVCDRKRPSHFYYARELTVQYSTHWQCQIGKFGHVIGARQSGSERAYSGAYGRQELGGARGGNPSQLIVPLTACFKRL